MNFAYHPSPNRSATLVSIVVIGRNEGERLRHCLQSIVEMKVLNFETETIYVDSGSTDESVTVAQSLGVKAISLVCERPSAAAGRNAGWRAAQGQFVLFLDGDTLLHPDFVADSLSEFAEDDVAVVWGHRRELCPQNSIYNRVLDLDWIYRAGLTTFCGGDALFRRRILVQTSGFDETLIAGEEPELCRRIAALGSKILHVDRKMTAHDLAIRHWTQYWKRAVRAGHAYAEVAERFRNTDNPFWSDASARNQSGALVLIGIVLFGWLACFFLWAVWPLMVTFLLLAGLMMRSAWRSRWKSSSLILLLLYGIHSHLQQIPIYWGQLRYRRNRRRGERSALLEYKQS
jgi:glycosyltransferase involved in cell wall biosynthesis